MSAESKTIKYERAEMIKAQYVAVYHTQTEQVLKM